MNFFELSSNEQEYINKHKDYLQKNDLTNFFQPKVETELATYERLHIFKFLFSVLGEEMWSYFRYVPEMLCRHADLTKVHLPNNIESIGVYAFADCQKLQSVLLEDGVKSIYDGAFLGCTRLHEITLPESLTIIGVEAFAGTAIRDIIIPESVVLLDANQFHGCMHMESIVLTKNLFNSVVDNAMKLAKKNNPNLMDNKKDIGESLLFKWYLQIPSHVQVNYL